MFDRLRRLFAAPARPAAEDDDLPLAVAALLVEAARADEQYEDRERALIDHALAARFELSPADAAALRARGEVAQAGAADLHRFTKIAKSMPADMKIGLVESLWRIVLSDAARDPHEDALIRRVCGLIYVSDPDSGAARRRVEAAAR